MFEKLAREKDMQDYKKIIMLLLLTGIASADNAHSDPANSHSDIVGLAAVTKEDRKSEMPARMQPKQFTGNFKAEIADNLKFQSTGSNVVRISLGVYAGGGRIARENLYIARGEIVNFENVKFFDAYCVVGIRGEYQAELAQQQQKNRERQTNMSLKKLFSFPIFDYEISFSRKKAVSEMVQDAHDFVKTNTGLKIYDHTVERGTKYQLGKRINMMAGSAFIFELLPEDRKNKVVHFKCHTTADKKPIKDIAIIADILRGKITLLPSG